jgi:hypothetical protein
MGSALYGIFCGVGWQSFRRFEIAYRSDFHPEKNTLPFAQSKA